MSGEQHTGWQWADLGPMTRGVIAAFSGRVGDEAQGDISDESFVAALITSFEEISPKAALAEFCYY